MQITLKSEFKWTVLVACIIFDIIDTGMDLLELGLSSFGVGSGIITGIGNTFDYLMILIGFVTLYLLGKDEISPLVFLPAAFDPMVDEAIPLPTYTGTYIFTVAKGWYDGRK